MAAGTAEKARPLNAEERRQLAALLERSGQRGVPAHREGQKYQALINLSVPRRGDADRQCDLVPAGETITLTDEEAALFLPPHKQIPMIRPVSEQGEPLQRIPARALAGQLRVPAMARPDPAGSTQVQVMEEQSPVPEASQVRVGSENSDGGASLAAQATEILDAMDMRVQR